MTSSTASSSSGVYYKLPAPQVEQENCVAHNGSVIPVPGRDIFAQAWYQGGLSVIDFTDSAKPVEIAYFDRGPIHEKHLVSGGYWSTYWYNGKIYGTEIARGLDVFALAPSKHLTENENRRGGNRRPGPTLQPAAAVQSDLAGRAGRRTGLHRSAGTQRGLVGIAAFRPEGGTGSLGVRANGRRTQPQSWLRASSRWRQPWAEGGGNAVTIKRRKALAETLIGIADRLA